MLTCCVIEGGKCEGVWKCEGVEECARVCQSKCVWRKERGGDRSSSERACGSRRVSISYSFIHTSKTKIIRSWIIQCEVPGRRVRLLFGVGGQESFLFVGGSQSGKMEFCRSQRHIPTPPFTTRKKHDQPTFPAHQPIQIAKAIEGGSVEVCQRLSGTDSLAVT